jgi:hypothetical protein
MKVHLNWKAILPVAKLFLAQASPAALQVEQEAEDVFSKEGRKLSVQEKSDRFVQIAVDSVHAGEDVAGKDLLNDPEVARLARGVGDAVVAFKNGLAAKAAGQPAKFVPANASQLDVHAGGAGD